MQVTPGNITTGLQDVELIWKLILDAADELGKVR
jgi:hypothetical protein